MTLDYLKPFNLLKITLQYLIDYIDMSSLKIFVLLGINFKFTSTKYFIFHSVPNIYWLMLAFSVKKESNLFKYIWKFNRPNVAFFIFQVPRWIWILFAVPPEKSIRHFRKEYPEALSGHKSEEWSLHGATNEGQIILPQSDRYSTACCRELIWNKNVKWRITMKIGRSWIPHIPKAWWL